MFAEWAVGERRRQGGMERKGDQGGVEEESYLTGLNENNGIGEHLKYS